MAPSRVRKKQPRLGSRKQPRIRTLPRAQVPAAVRTMATPSGTARFAAVARCAERMTADLASGA
jgi:hypothetical protein